MAFVEVKGLTKCFHGPVKALDAVSFKLEKGQILCVLGANGAGKSTLLKILAGLLLPDGGSARIDGLHPALSPQALRRRTGFAQTERPGFYERLTGRQNLEFFAALYGIAAAAASARIGELVQMTCLAAPDRPYQELSAGMKQRLLLARSLLHDPELLLLDEPTRSLDSAERERWCNMLDRFRRQGKAIVLSSHYRQEMEHLADRMLVLEQGRVQESR